MFWPLFLIAPRTLEAVTIYVLLGIIVSCFVLNRHNLGSQSVQKIIGGLTVFVVALLSHSTPVIGFSLFIGGLIIASEEFMAKLAIIFRSESKDLGTNVASLTTATKTEVQAKNKEEALDLVAAEVVSAASPAITRTLASQNATVKALVLDYLQDRYSNERYQILPEQKIDSPDAKSSVVVDGVLVENTPSKSEIVSLIEIQYVGSAYKFDRLLATIQRRVEVLTEVINDKPVVFYLAIDQKLSRTPRFVTFLEELNATRRKKYLGYFEVIYFENDQVIPNGKEVSLDLLTRS